MFRGKKKDRIGPFTRRFIDPIY